MNCSVLSDFQDPMNNFEYLIEPTVTTRRFRNKFQLLQNNYKQLAMKYVLEQKEIISRRPGGLEFDKEELQFKY